LGKRKGDISACSLFDYKTFHTDLEIKALHREVESLGDSYALREASEAYARQFAVEIATRSLENTIPWEKNAKSAET